MHTSDPHHLPYIAAFPQALGTGIIVTCSQRISGELRQRMASLIEDFEAAFSRFRTDSLVGRIAAVEQGGTFVFPDGLGAEALFALYDLLFAASNGTVDPLVGEELTKLGYGADMAYRMRTGGKPANGTVTPANDIINNSGSNEVDFNKPPTEGHDGRKTSASDLRNRPTWGDVVSHDGPALTVTQPIRLDFGAAGKGMMVDLLANLLAEELPDATYIVDAGGDLRVHESADARDSQAGSATEPLNIAMEDPADTTQAIGTIAATDGSLCASAPSRRHWQVRSGDALREVHHLLNALDGQPADDVKATWVFVPAPTSAATASRGDAARIAVSGGTGSAGDTGNSDMNDSTPASDDAPTQKYEWTAFDIARRYPTALADGLATALFVANAGTLAEAFAAPDGTPLFQCALIDADCNAAASPAFPGRFFTA
ncbi:thiamine biosynthesis protein ApbE [Bifidobacterium primatium]|uniref:FAD:protein FMN transferase n=1 Tax=Bifidobacterium primatium TaxID=2045438 RepID=A0A2M9HBE0_9BIFI|nr:FAD:protein FMN transferase [Bifidobacterium primatium]PJM74133.1 thiamine biosynthesis protein ApbE [Bifidobacterium primatium]